MATTDEQPTRSSLDWSKQYNVLHISRLLLRDQLRFTTEQVNRLSDEDMDRIAYWLENQFLDGGFYESVKFIVSLELAEKRSMPEHTKNPD